MQSEHPLGTLSCITGSWDHLPSNTLTPYKRCKPHWGFWVGFLGFLLVLRGLSTPKWLEENLAGLRKLSDEKPQSCSQTGCKMCCPKWRERCKPCDYCSSLSWLTDLGYWKAAFQMLQAKPSHTKVENKTLKGIHHPWLPPSRFPSQHTLTRENWLSLNLFAQASCLMLYIARPYIHFLTCTC